MPVLEEGQAVLRTYVEDAETVAVGGKATQAPGMPMIRVTGVGIGNTEVILRTDGGSAPPSRPRPAASPLGRPGSTLTTAHQARSRSARLARTLGRERHTSWKRMAPQPLRCAAVERNRGSAAQDDADRKPNAAWSESKRIGTGPLKPAPRAKEPPGDPSPRPASQAGSDEAADEQRLLAALAEELPPAKVARVMTRVFGGLRADHYAKAVAAQSRSHRRSTN